MREPDSMGGVVCTHVAWALAWVWGVVCSPSGALSALLACFFSFHFFWGCGVYVCMNVSCVGAHAQVVAGNHPLLLLYLIHG